MRCGLMIGSQNLLGITRNIPHDGIQLGTNDIGMVHNASIKYYGISLCYKILILSLKLHNTCLISPCYTHFMAKIEIYETEDDVKRDSLKKRLGAERGMQELGLQGGTLFTAMGALDVLFDKIGLFNNVREWNWVKKLNKFDPFPKSTKWLDKNMRTIDFSIGGALLVMGAIGTYAVSQTRKELAKLDKEERHVIIPDNLSSSALGQIPIGPVGEFELHKTPQEKITSHTERLMQEMGSESTRTL